MAEAVIEMPRSCSMSIQSEAAIFPPFPPTDHAGGADHARVEEELFGEGGLAGVRVADNGKRASLGRRDRQFILLSRIGTHHGAKHNTTLCGGGSLNGGEDIPWNRFDRHDGMAEATAPSGRNEAAHEPKRIVFGAVTRLSRSGTQ